MPHAHFPHLFSPFQLKHLTLKNRVAISGHHAGWWVDRGMPSEEFVAYIEERCDRGVGLFVIGCTSPKPGSGWLENLDDRVIPRYQACADAAHRHGTALIAQLCHPGFAHLPGVPLTLPVPAAKPTQPVYRPPVVHHVPSVAELQDLVRCFGEAAGRAAAGGVDGVELHSHEWFLHSQMINPMWNTRTDEYGGSPENRMRFMIETLRAMRAAVGPDRVVGIRLKADDMEQRGNSAEDYMAIIRRLEADQLVDYVLLTGGDARLHHGPMARPELEWLDLIRQHRANTRLPLLHAGRITTPQDAERCLAEGAMDLVVMTKSHIADAHFTRKAMEGRLDDIRLCTRCLQGCHHAMHRMTCVYNPRTSRELMWKDTPPAAKRKRIVIVGGGPAGMEAAVVASERGHDVVVIEKSSRVGGQVWVGASSPGRKPWSRIAEFYERQRAKGLFETRLNTVATPELVVSLRPDAVIIATGSTPVRAAIPGSERTLTVHEALAGCADRAAAAVVLDREASNRPWVVADALTSRSVKVFFVTPHLRVGPNVEHWTMDEMFRSLRDRGVEFLPGVDVLDRSDDAIRLIDVQTAEERIVHADTLVAAAGSVQVNDLATHLREEVSHLHVIGDANFPQTVEAATYQGARVGRMI